ncbi:MAG: hypothetical protein WDW36_005638 [Sanguina aurantia]
MTSCAICRRDRSSLFIEPRVNWQLQQALSAVRTLQAALTLTNPETAPAGPSSGSEPSTAPAPTRGTRTSSTSFSQGASQGRITLLRHVSTQYSPRAQPSSPRGFSSPHLRVNTRADLFHNFSYSPVHSSARNSNSSSSSSSPRHPLPLPAASPSLGLPDADEESDGDDGMSPLPFHTGVFRSTLDTSVTRTSRLHGINLADMDLPPLSPTHDNLLYSQLELDPDSPPYGLDPDDLPYLHQERAASFFPAAGAYAHLQIPHTSELAQDPGAGADSTSQERHNRGSRWTQRWRPDSNAPHGPPPTTLHADGDRAGGMYAAADDVDAHVVIGPGAGVPGEQPYPDASSTVSQMEAAFERHMAVLEQRQQLRTGSEVWPRMRGLAGTPAVRAPPATAAAAETISPAPVLRRLLAWPVPEGDPQPPTYYQSILRRQQQQQQQQQLPQPRVPNQQSRPPLLQPRLQLHPRRPPSARATTGGNTVATGAAADLSPAADLIARYEAERAATGSTAAAAAQQAPATSSTASMARAPAGHRYGPPTPPGPSPTSTAALRPAPPVRRLFAERHITPVGPSRMPAAAAASGGASSHRGAAGGLARQSGLLLSFLHEDVNGSELSFSGRSGQHHRFNRCRNLTLVVARCTSFKVSLIDCENVNVIATACIKLQLVSTRSRRVHLVLERNRELLLRCLDVSRLVVQGHSNTLVDVSDEGGQRDTARWQHNGVA